MSVITDENSIHCSLAFQLLLRKHFCSWVYLLLVAYLMLMSFMSMLIFIVLQTFRRIYLKTQTIEDAANQQIPCLKTGEFRRDDEGDKQSKQRKPQQS